MKPITQTNTGPTSISQQREKITFALNHGKQPKKSSTPQTGEHEESEETKANNAEGSKSETKSPEERKKESGSSLEQSETRDEELQVNEISSSVEEDKKQERSSAGEKELGNEPTVKGKF